MAVSNSSNMKKQAKTALKQVLPLSVVKSLRNNRLQNREKHKLESLAPSSYQGQNDFTIISAIYNVAPYLDDFFSSIFNQTLDRRYLRIIAVDDGSTDESADIIKKWQEKWPESIVYLHKENGGQAAARNLGLSCVETEWVTFIDPDDFVSRDYFEIVDRNIHQRPSLQMVACNLYYFQEDTGTFKNDHPLKNKFQSGDAFFACGDEQAYIQLSMSSAFFRMSKITANHLTVEEGIKPNFEDGHFVCKYLLYLEEGTLAFLKDPRYYYRKRTGGNSTIDTSWQSLDKFLNTPRNGYLDLLCFAKERCGRVPLNIQDTILYDISWYFKYLVGNSKCETLLSDPEKADEFFDILRGIFEHIDHEVLFKFPGRFLSFEVKCGISDNFYSEDIPFQIAYLKRINLRRKELLIESLSDDIRFYLNGSPVIPASEKTVSRMFCGRNFYHKKELWLPYGTLDDVLSYRLPSGDEVRLSTSGRQLKRSATVDTLRELYTEHWGKYKTHGDTWVIMDRDTQADDNGEHFYRYMMKNHPEQRCVFALRRESPNWSRLAAEGFKLVAFGTKEHERELRSCSKILSSHADTYVHSYFGDNFFKSKDYVFLQHGVTHNDISSWINGKPITTLVTVTEREYESITSDDTPYELTPEQVTWSGFPRHDRLLQINQSSDKNKKMILIAPTWRQFLMGKVIGKGNTRALNDAFAESDYAKSWDAFLASESLKRLAQQDNYRVVFFPHANILPYVKEGAFQIPPYIEIGSCENTSIQEYLGNASVCITDYSSVAFDIAYVGTPCIYYQFDKEQVYGGGHICGKGYFDYERDGFGPVVTTESQLEEALERVIENDFQPEQKYQRRMDETFVFHDGKCCERVYEAITRFDQPR